MLAYNNDSNKTDSNKKLLAISNNKNCLETKGYKCRMNTRNEKLLYKKWVYEKLRTMLLQIKKRTKPCLN